MLAIEKIRFVPLFAVAALCVVVGCKESGNAQQQNGNGDSASAAGLPEGFVLASMPEGVKNVAEAKGSVKAGDEVALRGRVGGASQPFIDGRAAFTIVDNSLKACSDIPGDMCRQPWDYCCEASDSLARHTATISVVSADGKPLRTSLRGIGGIEELSDVVVVGKVAQAEGNVLLVHAESIYVVAQ